MINRLTATILWGLAVLAYSCLSTGCVSGFTQMDDQWCNKHRSASHWHCWSHK